MGKIKNVCLISLYKIQISRHFNSSFPELESVSRLYDHPVCYSFWLMLKSRLSGYRIATLFSYGKPSSFRIPLPGRSHQDHFRAFHHQINGHRQPDVQGHGQKI